MNKNVYKHSINEDRNLLYITVWTFDGQEWYSIVNVCVYQHYSQEYDMEYEWKLTKVYDVDSIVLGVVLHASKHTAGYL